jgi:hypothetical protein
MSESKKICTTDIGRPWSSSNKPDNRRKLNLKTKSKKGKK